MNMEQVQREMPLLQRLEGPSVVPVELLRNVRTYRQACRLAWALRRNKGLTYRELAVNAGLVFQHVGDYFNPDDEKHRRSLPGEAVSRVEAEFGNTAISQWHALQAKLTVLEEMQCARRVA